MRPIAAALTLFVALLAGRPALAADQPVPAYTWTAADRAALVTAIDKALTGYTFTDKIPALQASISAHRDAYVAIEDPKAFAKAVSADLYAVAHDKHLRVNFSPTVLRSEAGGINSAALAHMLQVQTYQNNGYTSAIRLNGNVGYLRIDGFATMPQAQATIDAAMTLLANTDALIIDVRDNHGGDPDSLDYLMGYFYAKPVELTSIVVSTGGKKPEVFKQFSTAKVNGARYLGKPLYVLTSGHTFSCAEQFAYDMQSLHRATLIGETTGGGANPGGFQRLNDRFEIFIPMGHALNPYTGTNWEGTGVIPEVPVAANAALLEAYTRALHAASDSLDQAVLGRSASLADPAKALADSMPQL